MEPHIYFLLIIVTTSLKFFELLGKEVYIYLLLTLFSLTLITLIMIVVIILEMKAIIDFLYFLTKFHRIG